MVVRSRGRGTTTLTPSSPAVLTVVWVARLDDRDCGKDALDAVRRRELQGDARGGLVLEERHVDAVAGEVEKGDTRGLLAARGDEDGVGGVLGWGDKAGAVRGTGGGERSRAVAANESRHGHGDQGRGVGGAVKRNGDRTRGVRRRRVGVSHATARCVAAPGGSSIADELPQAGGSSCSGGRARDGRCRRRRLPPDGAAARAAGLEEAREGRRDGLELVRVDRGEQLRLARKSATASYDSVV